MGVAAGGTRAHCHLRSCRISCSPIATLVCVTGDSCSLDRVLDYTRTILPRSTSIVIPCRRLFRNVFQIIARRCSVACNLVSRGDVSTPFFVRTVKIVFPSDFQENRRAESTGTSYLFLPRKIFDISSKKEEKKGKVRVNLRRIN